MDAPGEKLSFPPTQSDLVMYAGIALLVYAVINRAWECLLAGCALAVAGLFAPRMTGPFSLGGPKLSFKGELAAPRDEDLTLAEGAQPGRLLPPAPPG